MGELRERADRLTELADDFPAIRANAQRLRASLRMMEINLEEIPAAPDQKKSG